MSETTPVCSRTDLQPQLTLRPSLWYCFYIVLFHSLPIAAIWLVVLSWPIQLLVTLLMVALAVWQCFRYWYFYPRRLVWQGNYWLLDNDRAILLADHSFHPYLLNLCFRYLEGTRQGRKSSWVILPTNVCADSVVGRDERLRRLRFLLLNTSAVFHSSKSEEKLGGGLTP